MNLDSFRKASEAAAQKTESGIAVVAADYRKGHLALTLASGVEMVIPVRLLEGLAAANPEDLKHIKISPSGFGLHFPNIDADLYVPALLQGVFGSARWMASAFGRKGGLARSQNKAASSRANGKLGGRPPKKKTVPQ